MKIMVCYNGSDASKEALELASKHARAFNGTIYVVSSLVGDSQEQLKSLEKAEQDLAYARVFLGDNNLACETKLLTGGLSAGEGLVNFARDNDIDEIIIGVVKKSKVGKLIFGSTAQYVILEASCPVLTVK